MAVTVFGNATDVNAVQFSKMLSPSVSAFVPASKVTVARLSQPLSAYLPSDVALPGTSNAVRPVFRNA